MVKKNGLSILMLLVFVVLAAGSVSTDEAVENKVTSSPASVIGVSASELFAAYEGNEVAADGRYKGQILEVTGTVDNIGKDITNTMYVALASGNPILGVQCFFADAHQSALANLSKGQYVKIRGKCDGVFGNVILRGCQLAD